MLRRGVGVGAVKKRQQAQSQFTAVGAALEESQVAHLQSSLSSFRASLEAFAFAHKEAIRQQPLFRAQFHAMCRSIGVDPLACTKGVWSSVLGLGDFYFELGVQIMDACIASRAHNGGLMTVGEVQRTLINNKYKGHTDITLDDICQSVSKLSCLGSGFVLLPIGGPKNVAQHLLKSVPLEMNVDHLALLDFAAAQGAVDTAGEKGCVMASAVHKQLGWSESRIATCLQLMMEEGMLWIDTQGPEKAYWFPSLATAMS